MAMDSATKPALLARGLDGAAECLGAHDLGAAP